MKSIQRHTNTHKHTHTVSDYAEFDRVDSLALASEKADFDPEKNTILTYLIDDIFFDKRVAYISRPLANRAEGTYDRSTTITKNLRKKMFTIECDCLCHYLGPSDG